MFEATTDSAILKRGAGSFSCNISGSHNSTLQGDTNVACNNVLADEIQLQNNLPYLRIK